MKLKGLLKKRVENYFKEQVENLKKLLSDSQQSNNWKLVYNLALYSSEIVYSYLNDFRWEKFSNEKNFINLLSEFNEITGTSLKDFLKNSAWYKDFENCCLTMKKDQIDGIIWEIETAQSRTQNKNPLPAKILSSLKDQSLALGSASKVNEEANKEDQALLNYLEDNQNVYDPNMVAELLQNHPLNSSNISMKTLNPVQLQVVFNALYYKLCSSKTLYTFLLADQFKNSIQLPQKFKEECEAKNEAYITSLKDNLNSSSNKSNRKLRELLLLEQLNLVTLERDEKNKLYNQFPEISLD